MIKIKKFKESILKYGSPDTFRELVKKNNLPELAKKNNPLNRKEHLNLFLGEIGNLEHATGNMRCYLPVSYVLKMTGQYQEIREWNLKGRDFYFGNYPIEDWYELIVKDIAENGLENPIFIIVDYNRKPVISEGNHRIQAFKQLELKFIPCEIKFFGKSEDNFIEVDNRNPELTKKIEELRND